jgi:hypothetical protein
MPLERPSSGKQNDLLCLFKDTFSPNMTVVFLPYSPDELYIIIVSVLKAQVFTCGVEAPFEPPIETL